MVTQRFAGLVVRLTAGNSATPCTYGQVGAAKSCRRTCVRVLYHEHLFDIVAGMKAELDLGMQAADALLAVQICTLTPQALALGVIGTQQIIDRFMLANAQFMAACQWPIVSARRRSVDLPVGGHQNCPLMANGTAQ